MKALFDWIRIKSRARSLFNEAVGPKPDVLNERQKLAKLFSTALDITMEKGMFAIWRPVTEVNQARENQTMREQFARSGGKPPLQDISDLDDLHMRPLMFHLERSVIPRIFQDPGAKPHDWMKINDRIDRLVAYNLRAPKDEKGKAALLALLAKPFDGNDETDPGHDSNSYPESSEGLTGYQSLKGFAQVCQIMLAHAPSFRLTATQQDVLRETVRACEYCVTPGYRPELPAAAQKDMDDFHREMAMGGMKFTKEGAVRMKAELGDYPGAFDEDGLFDDGPEDAAPA